MNKKLILLMLALPLILMLSLFTATSTVSLTISVPVERIEISSSEVVYLDLDREETYTVEYTVYPTNAANKEVSFSTARIGNDPLAELTFENGVLTPRSCGKARVTLTTYDGGFTDSFIVQVDSKSLQAIESTLADTIIDVGQETTINTVFTPKNAPNKQLRYEVVEGDEFVTVNAQGVVRGVGVGTAKVRVISRMNEGIYDEVEITVSNSAAMQFVTKKVANTMQQNGGFIPLYIDGNVTFEYDLETLNKDGVVVENVLTFHLNREEQKLEYTFVNENFEGQVTVRLTVRVDGMEPYTDSCQITRVREIQASWVGASSIAVALGSTTYVHFELTPSDVEINYTVAYENDQGYISVVEDIANGQLIITAESVGATFADSYTDIILKISAKNNPEHVITLRLSVSVY